MDADAVDIRVLGCLIEKQRTTPDVYPLSLNALRLACNQTTNRDPVVDYDEPTIRAALERLSRKGWTRLASGAGSRAVKYRHLLSEALGLSPAEISLLAVMMLRGPQTLGELKGRSERLYRFESLGEVEQTLERLAERDLIVRLPRRPGQKEERYAQLLGGEGEPEAGVREAGVPDAAEASEGIAGVGETGPSPPPADGARIARLEERVDRLEGELASVRRALESLRPSV